MDATYISETIFNEVHIKLLWEPNFTGNITDTFLGIDNCPGWWDMIRIFSQWRKFLMITLVLVRSFNYKYPIIFRSQNNIILISLSNCNSFILLCNNYNNNIIKYVSQTNFDIWFLYFYIGSKVKRQVVICFK